MVLYILLGGSLNLERELMFGFNRSDLEEGIERRGIVVYYILLGGSLNLVRELLFGFNRSDLEGGEGYCGLLYFIRWQVKFGKRVIVLI